MNRILKAILAVYLIAIATVVFVYPHLMVGPGRLSASCHKCCGRRPACHDWP
ncbi:MAG: hypothetical protein V5B39_21825 [Accumulibacter sp.]|jgi:hypothetical protein|uniref:hypothetical protein n=1 Tax=Accumulibacter sp. TaxID=2053492 RepID=UPI002FC3A7E2